MHLIPDSDFGWTIWSYFFIFWYQIPQFSMFDGRGYPKTNNVFSDSESLSLHPINNHVFILKDNVFSDSESFSLHPINNHVQVNGKKTKN